MILYHTTFQCVIGFRAVQGVIKMVLTTHRKISAILLFEENETLAHYLEIERFWKHSDVFNNRAQD